MDKIDSRKSNLSSQIQTKECISENYKLYSINGAYSEYENAGDNFNTKLIATLSILSKAISLKIIMAK